MIYIDPNDWWIGVYRGPNHWYVCLVPCVVIRLRNKNARADLQVAKAGYPGGIRHDV